MCARSRPCCIRSYSDSIFSIWRRHMNEKQYLEAVNDLLSQVATLSTVHSHISYPSTELCEETMKRLEALKAQEDNIKSDHWEEQDDK